MEFAPTSPIESTGGMDHVDKLKFWADRLEPSNAQDIPRSGSPHSIVGDDADIELDESHIELQKYQELLKGSSSVSWVCLCIGNSLRSTVHGRRSTEVINDLLLRNLPKKVLSRTRRPCLHLVVVMIDWNPLQYLKQQGYVGSPRDDLKSTLTVTGDASNAQITTCERYIEQTWQQSEVEIFSALQKMALSSAEPSILTFLLMYRAAQKRSIDVLRDDLVHIQPIAPQIQSVSVISHFVSFTDSLLCRKAIKVQLFSGDLVQDYASKAVTVKTDFSQIEDLH